MKLLLFTGSKRFQEVTEDEGLRRRGGCTARILGTGPSQRHRKNGGKGCVAAGTGGKRARASQRYRKNGGKRCVASKR